MPNSAGQRQLWRVSTRGRVGGVLAFLGFLAITLWITIDGNHTPGAGNTPTVILWVVTLGMALAVWRLSFIPYIEATDSDLVVQNAFDEVHIPWNQIEAIRPGSLGLAIKTKGRTLPRNAWAVQKGRGAQWAKTHTRADDVTLALMEHVHLGSPSGVEAPAAPDGACVGVRHVTLGTDHATRYVPLTSNTTLILFTVVFGLFGLFAVVGLMAPHGTASERITASCVLIVCVFLVLACMRPLLMRRRSDHSP